MVVTQPLLDNRFLFGTKADLLGAAAGITNRQDPNGMAISVGTHGTAGAMTNDAAEQRATDDLGVKGRAAASLARLRRAASFIIYIDETTIGGICQEQIDIFFLICFIASRHNRAR